MNSIYLSTEFQSEKRIIEIKFFDKITLQDIKYTVSREFYVRIPEFFTSNGVKIKDEFLPEYIQNFCHDPSFMVLIKESAEGCGSSGSGQTNATSVQFSQFPNGPKNFRTKEELLEFLQTNSSTRLFLMAYQQKNELTNQARIKISKAIIQNLLLEDPSRRIHRTDFDNIIDLICQLFPGEKRDTYVLRTKKHISGKLYDAYNNYRASLFKHGILQRPSKSQENDETNQNQDTMLEMDDTQQSTFDQSESEEKQLRHFNLNTIGQPITHDGAMSGIFSPSISTVLPTIQSVSSAQHTITSGAQTPMTLINHHIPIKSSFTDNLPQHFRTIQHLRTFLENNSSTRIIFVKYLKEQELSNRDRIIISKEIIRYLLQDPNRVLTREHFEEIGALICKIFPTEIAHTYYQRFISGKRTAGGKLYDAYNNYKVELCKVGIIQRRSKRAPGEEETQTNADQISQQSAETTEPKDDFLQIFMPDQIKQEKCEIVGDASSQMSNDDEYEIHNESIDDDTSSQTFESPPPPPLKRKREDEEEIEVKSVKDDKIVVKKTEKTEEALELENKGSKHNHILNNAVKMLAESFRDIQKEFITEFFKNQEKLQKEDHEFQRKQDELFFKTFDEHNKILISFTQKSSAEEKNSVSEPTSTNNTN